MAGTDIMTHSDLILHPDPSRTVLRPFDVSDPDGTSADQRLDADVLAALRTGGGRVDVVEHAVLPVNFACPNLITVKDGIRTGITDVMSPWSAAVAQG